jgi:hypothetical protein
VFGLCVGYADPSVNVEVKPRLPQAAILHRETYKLGEQDEAIALYNQVMKAFYNSQNMNCHWQKSLVTTKDKGRLINDSLNKKFHERCRIAVVFKIHHSSHIQI